MPDGDGTGPRWGQGRWKCRRGAGRPMGFGPRGRFACQSGDELSQLKAYAKDLDAELEDVKKRIASLEKA